MKRLPRRDFPEADLVAVRSGAGRDRDKPDPRLRLARNTADGRRLVPGEQPDRLVVDGVGAGEHVGGRTDVGASRVGDVGRLLRLQDLLPGRTALHRGGRWHSHA